MATIPCIATAVVEELPKELGIELISRWMQLGLKIECFKQYRSK